MNHLLPTLGLLFFALIFIVMILYIAIIGRIGWQFFMYNNPLTKKRGTFYLILLRNGRFKWVYGAFKTVWEWPDKSKTYIGKAFDRLYQTTEPLIFLVEGYPTNPMLSELLPKKEMSELVNNIIKTQETAARLEMDLGKTKPAIFDKIIPIFTLLAAAGSLLIGFSIMVGINEIQPSIDQLVSFANEIKPHIPELVKALENLPRDV